MVNLKLYLTFFIRLPHIYNRDTDIFITYDNVVYTCINVMMILNYIINSAIIMSIYGAGNVIYI